MYWAVSSAPKGPLRGWLHIMYNVYILKSKKDGGYYIGCTAKDPLIILAEHNSGNVKSTKPRRMFVLVHVEKYREKKKAFKREWHLKHPSGYTDKINIINNLGR